jgi:uncharacterized membrane protein YkvA (DUF1232 family)
MSSAAKAAAAARGAAAMAARSTAIAEYLQRVSPKKFGQLIRRVELAAECLRDVAQKRYRLPWKTVGALTAALAYFLSPVDLIPDFIPLSGFVDDAAVLGLVFAAAEVDLRRYCTWRGLDPREYFEALVAGQRLSG